MALLGNRTVLQKSLATFRNGTATAGAYAGVVLNNFNNTGTNRNIFFHVDKKSAVPVGYLPPYTWVLAQKTGGIGSTRKILGSGVLVPPSVQAIKAVGATIGGSGDVSPAPVLQAARAMGSTLAGTSTCAGTSVGLGIMESTITPFTGLTPANIASEILDGSTVETSLTVREALKLISAAVAGKLSGAAGTTITIRNAVDDSKNRIIATVDSDGNRTAITYDVT